MNLQEYGTSWYEMKFAKQEGNKWQKLNRSGFPMRQRSG